MTIEKYCSSVQAIQRGVRWLRLFSGYTRAIDIKPIAPVHTQRGLIPIQYR